MIIFLSNNMYDVYELYFYMIQDQLYQQFIYSISHLSIYVAIFVFFLGIVTSFTPCFISIVPLSLAYINSRRKYNYSFSWFISGLVTSTLLTILCINLLNYNYVNRIPLISSWILLLISLNLLQILDFTFLNINTGNLIKQINNYNNNDLYDYIIGLIIGVSSLPCSSPLIYIISFWLNHSGSMSIAILYFLIYTIGYIFALLCIFYFTAAKISNFVQFWDLTVPLSGFFILTISVFNILEKICY